MTATITETLQIELTADQARLLHAVLCDALTTTRDRQAFWLEQHEALAAKSPVMSGEAWQTFKAWEARETTACQAIDAIRATGLELGHLSAFGLPKR
jgi:hypothetical protein